MDINQLVATQIKEMRKNANLSAEYVAGLLGITIGAYSNLENGKVGITVKKLHTLSIIFKKPISSFWTNAINSKNLCPQDLDKYSEIVRLHQESIENLKIVHELLQEKILL